MSKQKAKLRWFYLVIYFTTKNFFCISHSLEGKYKLQFHAYCAVRMWIYKMYTSSYLQALYYGFYFRKTFSFHFLPINTYVIVSEYECSCFVRKEFLYFYVKRIIRIFSRVSYVYNNFSFVSEEVLKTRVVSGVVCS